ncbi:MAG: sulfite exporter TauE/SafE family protein, partial [Chitinophagales bacterium]|nr:sulfite exporter TauE/SafE family protein [Chitinophagales bacterium]
IIFALVFINKLDLVRVNSIKVTVVLIYTIAALAVFIYNDQVNWKFGLTLAAGNSTGGWIASRWSVKKGDKWIKRFMVVTVIALAIKLWMSS